MARTVATVTAAEEPMPNLRPETSSSWLSMRVSKNFGATLRRARTRSTVVIADMT